MTRLVTGQAEGAAAAREILAGGGNAVDAAVTAALVAGVVAVPSCGIGGYGGHMVIARPDGKVAAIDFNSTAPAAARADMFSAGPDGKVPGEINLHGWRAAGVPGTLAGLQLALDRFGTRPLSQLLAPAIHFARDGFAVSRGLARAICSAAAQFKSDPGSAKLFLKNGEPLPEGATFRNPDLAAMLEVLASANSVQPFYRGKIAERIAAAFQKNGGLVTADDLAAYRAQEVTPLSLAWNQATIFTAPLTAGGLTVLQVLTTLKSLKWEMWARDDPKTTHARVEAMRLAWHDRLTLLGDPQKADVQVRRLLSAEYAEAAAERIRDAVKSGKPLAVTGDRRPAGGTIHLSAADANGMMVALTLTHGEAFGAQVTVDGLGLILGHGMSRFDVNPKHPNAPGPGKRPLHNMCPCIVVKDGRPVIALGAVGGRRIPNTLCDVLIGRVGYGLPLAEAVQAPRMHTHGDLNLNLTQKWSGNVRDYLKKVGYAVKPGAGAVLNAIERNARTGELTHAAG
jgi:gamma-glutamyltranspeptidase/glutathione hydrolase